MHCVPVHLSWIQPMQRLPRVYLHLKFNSYSRYLLSYVSQLTGRSTNFVSTSPLFKFESFHSGCENGVVDQRLVVMTTLYSAIKGFLRRSFIRASKCSILSMSKGELHQPQGIVNLLVKLRYARHH